MGPVKFVEIDESKFGKRKYHRGRLVEGVWVFGGIERDSNPPKCFFIPVEDRSAATLIPIIKQWIKPGTTVLSDCSKAYHSLIHSTVSLLTTNPRFLYDINQISYWYFMQNSTFSQIR